VWGERCGVVGYCVRGESCGIVGYFVLGERCGGVGYCVWGDWLWSCSVLCGERRVEL